MRSHVRDKGHDVAGVSREWSGAEEKRERGDGENEDGLRQRSLKRRKILTDAKNGLKSREDEEVLNDGHFELDLDGNDLESGFVRY